jgi:hypothetical protein
MRCLMRFFTDVPLSFVAHQEGRKTKTAPHHARPFVEVSIIQSRIRPRGEGTASPLRLPCSANAEQLLMQLIRYMRITDILAQWERGLKRSGVATGGADAVSLRAGGDSVRSRLRVSAVDPYMQSRKEGGPFPHRSGRLHYALLATASLPRGAVSGQT